MCHPNNSVIRQLLLNLNRLSISPIELDDFCGICGEYVCDCVEVEENWW